MGLNKWLWPWGQLASSRWQLIVFSSYEYSKKAYYLTKLAECCLILAIWETCVVSYNQAEPFLRSGQPPQEEADNFCCFKCTRSYNTNSVFHIQLVFNFCTWHDDRLQIFDNYLFRFLHFCILLKIHQLLQTVDCLKPLRHHRWHYFNVPVSQELDYTEIYKYKRFHQTESISIYCQTYEDCVEKAL